ncbi:hypothetical protein K440DRAFT_204959 [Wilcoxina mikolae CBS 423.85]|nr:hypothetical protein K440DRAFT_204959 [Wilcoxina mikolae CBS 423.85]
MYGCFSTSEGSFSFSFSFFASFGYRIHTSFVHVHIHVSIPYIGVPQLSWGVSFFFLPSCAAAAAAVPYLSSINESMTVLGDCLLFMQCFRA